MTAYCQVKHHHHHHIREILKFKMNTKAWLSNSGPHIKILAFVMAKTDIRVMEIRNIELGKYLKINEGRGYQDFTDNVRNTSLAAPGALAHHLQRRTAYNT